MSVPVSDPIGNDPIGARATLRGLLELRSALELDDDGGRRLPPLEASSPPADASGGWGEQPSSSCCLESERLLLSEVQVRVGGTDQMKGGKRGRLEREGRERGRSNRCSFFFPKNLTEPFFPEKSHRTFFPRKISPNLSRQKKRSHRTSSAAPARPPLARNTPRPSAPCAFVPAGTSWICHWRALRTFSKRARRRRRAAAAQPRRRRRRRRHSIFALYARGPPRCSTRGGHCSRTARPRRRRSWPRPRSGRGPRKRGPRRRRRRCESS